MQSRQFTDQLNRKISIDYPPKRIISLVPSQTELLFDLGLDNELVGITKFCIHPEEKVRSKSKIGGTKKVNIEKIRELKPDLIIGNKEENEKDQIEALMQEFPVWMSDVYTFDDALGMIEEVGKVVGKEHRAKSIAIKIKKAFNAIVTVPHAPSALLYAPSTLRIAYFIWKDPYIVAGTNTFIDNIIGMAGWENAFELARYPEISADDLKKTAPDVVMLSSEPYPFKEKHIAEFQSICPNIPVVVADGELFSWYGSRLQYTPAYIKMLKKQIYDLQQT